MIDWIKTVQGNGCGEILLTSIDQEGTELGFDIDLINNIKDYIKKPLIISGGCGSIQDILQIKENYVDDSVALASVLHYKKFSISNIKDKITS